MNPQAIAAVLLMAGIVEGLVEYLAAPIAVLKPYLGWVSIVVGIAVALAFGLDLVPMLGVPEPYPLAGVVLTGVLIGRFGNHLSDFMATVRALPSTAGKP